MDCGGEAGSGQDGGAAGASVGGAGAGGTGAGGSTAGSSGTAGSEGGIAVSQIALNQAVKIPLVESGLPASPSAVPIVGGKDAMLKVFVEPSAGFRKRELVARLELVTASGTTPIESSKLVSRPSSDADSTTSFNFPIDGASIWSATEFSIELRESAGTPVPGTRYPSSGTARFEAQSSNGNLRVTLVPLVVNGFVPDTSSAVVGRFQRRVRSMFPVPDVEVSVRAALALPYDVPPDGDEWEDALDDLYALRALDAPADNVFYYGILTPKPTFDEYCYVDCTIGLAVLNDPGDVEFRGAIGTGFFSDGSGEDAGDTLAHELGHTLGRGHSPCGTGGDADPFPYSDGYIGVWGYDMEKRSALDPRRFTDLMGYCAPVWISDYTYEALFDRIRLVNAAPKRAIAPRSGQGSRYRVVRVAADGTLRWGRESLRREPPRGRPEPVTFLDEVGRGVAQTVGHFHPFDHRAGGFLLVPAQGLERGRGIAALRADRLGRTPLPL